VNATVASSSPAPALLQGCTIASDQDGESLAAALLARCPLARSLDLCHGLSSTFYRALAASNHVQELKLTGDNVRGSEEFITKMTTLCLLRLPTWWYAPLSELQALMQLQHLSLGEQVNAGQFTVADLNAILRNCPLRSLVLGYILFDPSAMDWAACSGTLVSLQVGREDVRQPHYFERLPIAHAILPALKLLSVEILLLMSPGDSLAGVIAGITAAVAASPDLRVEVGRFYIRSMRAAEVLEVLGPLQNRIHVQDELSFIHVQFESPVEVAAMARLLPCRLVHLCGCVDDDTSATAMALRAWVGEV